MTDSELQIIVDKYFNHINGVEHLMPNFPKPEPKPYPPVMTREDLYGDGKVILREGTANQDRNPLAGRSNDFWDRVEEQRRASVREFVTTGVHTRPSDAEIERLNRHNQIAPPGEKRPPGAVAKGHMDGVTLFNARHPYPQPWYDKWRWPILLAFLTVFGTTLFAPEILDLVRRLYGEE